MESGFLLTLGRGQRYLPWLSSPRQAADLGLVAYEMAILVRRTGEHIRGQQRAAVRAERLGANKSHAVQRWNGG